MASELSSLGVGHAYAPGHEPEMLNGLAAVMAGGSPALLLAIAVSAALIGIVLIYRATRGPSRRNRPSHHQTLAAAGAMPAVDAGAILRRRMR